ncbi:amidohydrolase [Mycobacterium sp. IS-1590]|uniref:amidohydrolase family protein n=1 Tax=Mycobacterium sp. IS-1590 TaxID=1772286 RepID=UPI0007462663|nr:amidohydrolase family protein [Mycobacterium sp. IS-1590]KUI35854.1 amidohydrolase [Mycobacterium sp. IS-1590]
MLIQRATLLDGAAVDIRVAEEVTAVEPVLSPRAGEPIYDAAGRTVIPGLHDHHVHLRSAAAALRSVRVGPAEVRNRAELARALANVNPGADGWVRAVGYHEAVAGPLDRTVLDEVAPALPVRVQHRSGVLWTLNSAGLARVGMADHPDGRLRSADRSWSDALQRNEAGLGEVSSRLSGLGVTGVTDATPDLEIDDVVRLLESHRCGELRQRVLCLAPGKRILHDSDLDLDGLTSWISGRHAEGAPVAVHCVTAAQLVVTLSALQTAGTHPGDRIEHASVVADDVIASLAASGVTVVTQPNFVTERGDQYLADVPVDEHHELWRVASLLRAGVPVALSTDMPFGQGDPWATMRAAVRRVTGSGAVLGADERIAAAEALGMFLGTGHDPLRRRTVAPGQPGDLAILELSPDDVFETLASDMVDATVIGGEVVFERG